jgi:hypothetical protein
MDKKFVSWDVVRNIANRLTNQLYMGDGVDISEAHMSCFTQGPSRNWKLEESRTGNFRSSEGSLDGWMAFCEEDVSQLLWESLTSGNKLEAVKIGPNKWELTYIPSLTDPNYRGCYFGIFEDPESMENIDASYVYQYR